MMMLDRVLSTWLKGPVADHMVGPELLPVIAKPDGALQRRAQNPYQELVAGKYVDIPR